MVHVTGKDKSLGQLSQYGLRAGMGRTIANEPRLDHVSIAVPCRTTYSQHLNKAPAAFAVWQRSLICLKRRRLSLFAPTNLENVAPGLLKMVDELVTQGDVVWDVGANVEILPSPLNTRRSNRKCVCH